MKTQDMTIWADKPFQVLGLLLLQDDNTTIKSPSKWPEGITIRSSPLADPRDALVEALESKLVRLAS